MGDNRGVKGARFNGMTSSEMLGTSSKGKNFVSSFVADEAVAERKELAHTWSNKSRPWNWKPKYIPGICAEKE